MTQPQAKTTGTRELQPCGTQAAYIRHLRAGEEPCEACRKANARAGRGRLSRKIHEKASTRARKRIYLTYQQEYQDLLSRERARTDLSPRGVYERARAALVRLHLDEYQAILAQELEAARADPGRKPASRWRMGARDDAARAAHKAEIERFRRRAVKREFRPVETRLLNLIRVRTPIDQAAARVGLTVQAVFGRARWDGAWSERLDAALIEGRDPNITHGTEWSYRKHKCRCPDCREAKSRYR